jgi:hypothetical protein
MRKTQATADEVTSRAVDDFMAADSYLAKAMKRDSSKPLGVL